MSRLKDLMQRNLQTSEKLTSVGELNLYIAQAF